MCRASDFRESLTADKAQDRRLAIRRKLAHREIFDNPLLNLFEAEKASSRM
jgi:hypothetical protein